MRGIVCHGTFSKSNPKHALAINWEHEAYNEFMKKLKSEDLDSLKSSLDFKIRETAEKQKKAQKLNDTYQQAYKNINDSDIPIY